jgi:hypothetical protein
MPGSVFYNVISLKFESIYSSNHSQEFTDSKLKNTNYKIGEKLNRA